MFPGVRRGHAGRQKQAQFGQGEPGRVADDVHGPPGLVGTAGQQRRCRFRLDRHQADVMRHDIVQFARDGSTLMRRGAGRLAVHFGFGPVGPALGRDQVRLPGPAERAHHPQR